jgi:hypothetical protein
VASQFLQGAQIDPAATGQREVSMPQRVEVDSLGAVGSLNREGDAGRLQVDAEHLGAAAA